MEEANFYLLILIFCSVFGFYSTKNYDLKIFLLGILPSKMILGVILGDDFSSPKVILCLIKLLFSKKYNFDLFGIHSQNHLPYS